MKNLLTFLSFLIALSLGAQTQFGTDFVGGGTSYFTGSDVDITADAKRIIFGEPGAFNNTGIVKVYEESGNGWVQIGSDIVGPGGTSFGISVAISDDGTRVAVGAIGDGTVTIFEDYGGVWTSFGQQVTGGASGDEFGWEIDLSNDGKRLAVSTGYGSVTRVYEESSLSWSKVGADIPSASSSDVALSADGTRVAVTNAANGAAVYDESGGTWTQVGSTLTGWSNSISLSADGKRVVSGSGGNGFSVYEENAGAWTALGTVTDPVGSSVAIAGDGKSVVSGGISADEVRLYEESGGTWTQSGMTLTGNNNSYGGAVAINQNGGRFILGACCDDPTYYGLVQTYNSPLNTSINTMERLSGSMVLSPNPSSGGFELQLTDLEVGAAMISITDMLGRVVWTHALEINSGNWSGLIELTDQGVYTVSVEVGGKLGQKRLVIAR